MEGLERMSLRSIVLHNEPVFFTGTKLFNSCAIFWSGKYSPWSICLCFVPFLSALP